MEIEEVVKEVVKEIELESESNSSVLELMNPKMEIEKEHSQLDLGSESCDEEEES